MDKIIAYIDIVFEFYRELGVANQDDEAYMISVQRVSVTFSVDAVFDFLGIPQLLIAYLNMIPRESIATDNGEMDNDKGTNIDGLDGLIDHEV